jgi:hypothetical protein
MRIEGSMPSAPLLGAATTARRRRWVAAAPGVFTAATAWGTGTAGGRVSDPDHSDLARGPLPPLEIPGQHQSERL